MRRMMKTTGLFTGLAVIAVMALATTAQAATVKEILISQLGGIGATDNLVLNDADWSVVFDSTGSVKTSGSLVVGDFFLGTVKIVSSDVGAPGGTAALNQGINQGLVGVYALRVDSISGSSVDDVITTGALTDAQVALFTGIPGLSGLASYGFGDTAGNAMVAWFLDGDTNGQSTGTDTVFDDSTPFDFDTVTDGDFWASFGNGTYNIIADNTALFDVAAASAHSGQIATVALDVENVLNNTGYLLFNSNMTEDTRPGSSNASVLFGGGLAGNPVTSDISFLTNVTVVPVPAAAWMGFAMLGLLGAGRIMRRQPA